jgi:hypothetical protein
MVEILDSYESTAPDMRFCVCIAWQTNISQLHSRSENGCPQINHFIYIKEENIQLFQHDSHGR